MCKIEDWIILILLGICGFEDRRKRMIPVLLLIIMSVVVVICVFYCDVPTVWQRISGLCVGLCFFGISKITKEAIGYGDSWLILLLGVHEGGLNLVQILFVASLIAGFAALFYLWKHRWKKTATIPFVPFLALAYLGAMFA